MLDRGRRSSSEESEFCDKCTPSADRGSDFFIFKVPVVGEPYMHFDLHSKKPILSIKFYSAPPVLHSIPII